MISHTLKTLRENGGYTQKQVADALNVARSTYSYYETGRTIPDIDTIIRLAKFFDVPYTDILESEADLSIAKMYDIAAEGEFFDKYLPPFSAYIYDLTKDEQQLVMGYRLLPAQMQEEILADICKKTQLLFNKSSMFDLTDF